MKKLFTLLIALVATTALLAEDFKINGIYYKILKDKTNEVDVTYRGSNYYDYDNEYSGSITIPSTVTYNGTTYSVTGIGDAAFRFCSGLTSITIPNSVKVIRYRAFYGCSLTSITIPNSVTSIEDEVFAYGSSLTTMVVETGNTIYDSRNNCNAIIKTATNELISGCQNTVIPNSVTRIGNGAFNGCSSLTSITIPNSVTSIGDRVFVGSGIYEDKSKWENRVLYIDNCLISADNFNSGAYTIKENTRLIADEAFLYCDDLTSITIPNSVTSIGNGAFYGCSGLTSITIGNSVTSIGNEAFYGCSGLTSVIIPNSVISIGNEAFNGCSSLTSITIPNSVTSIGDYAFYNCSSLTSVTIPNSVTSIGNGAFNGCSSLTSVVWNSKNCTDPSSLSYTPFYSIRSQITSFVIGDSVEYIPAYLCYRMNSITSITVPNNVNSIGRWAFYCCSSLASVAMQSNTPPEVGTGILEGISSNAVLYISDTADKQAYQKALGEYFSKIVGGRAFSYKLKVNFYENQGSVEILQQPDWDTPAIIKATPKDGYVFGRWDDGEIDNPRTINVTSDTTMWAYFAPTSGECGDNLTWKYSNNTLTISGTGDMWDFSGTDVPWEDLCGQVHTISLPTGITSISDRAFFAFTEITSIDLPSSLISIGSSAFMYCEKLTSITIPDKVTMIGNSAFHGCTNLKHISIGKALKEIGHSNYSKNDVFRNCTNLTSVEWNARECADFDSHERTLFGSVASQITSFTFGKDVQYIPQYLCYELDKITSITIPNRVTKIGNFAFESCSLLSNLNIGGSVEEIGMFTFANCDKLTNITIPDGVTSIGNYAFSDCKNLTSVSIGYGLKHFGYLNDGSGAFSNCPKLKSVVWNAQACADFEVSEEAPFYAVAQQITSFTFGNRVEHIPAFLCYDMKKLATLQFPSTLKVIGESAFESCESLKYVAIPDQVTTIHNWAFAWCLGLTQVTFGERLQQIGSGAFCDCTSIKEMTSNASQVPEITYATFDNVEPSTTVYVKEPLIEQYKQHPYWGKFNIVAVKSPVDNISYSEANTHKLLRNGQLIIVRNGVEYNAQGGCL